MAYSLIWLPQVLRAAGLKVAETNGWADRGRGEMATVRGVICHHTGVAAKTNMPSLNLLINGRGGDHPLSGPLAQIGLARDGTCYIIAAGRANHAGPGEWRGIRTGNTSFIGIEAENGGTEDEEWPIWQMDAYKRCVAAILKHLRATSEMCCGHREYALPKGRKIDPIFNMDQFRADVQSIIDGTALTRPSVPQSDPATGKPTIERGARGSDVEIVQRAVGVEADGKFGPATEAAVRTFQRSLSLRSDGVVGPNTWAAILAATPEGDATAELAAAILPGPVVPVAVTAAPDDIPAAARSLLAFIGKKESKNNYDCLFGNNEDKLPKKLTTMTLAEVLAAGPSWSRSFRSSACGCYQFMNATLLQLKKTQKLNEADVFDKDYQDKLGYALLKGRGYGRFASRELSVNDFALGLAQEWASMPVLADCKGQHRRVKRGETYYAGDGVNKALISPEALEDALKTALTLL